MPHGKDTIVLLGATDVSAWFRGADVSSPIDMADSTVYGLESRTFEPGMSGGSFTFEGVWSVAEDPVIDATLGTAAGQVLTVCRTGSLAVGQRVDAATIRASNHAISSPVGDIVSLAWEAQADGGIDESISLHALTAEVAGGNSASVDNGASSPDGLAATLHVTAFTGTDITVKIQHSTDDSVWVDLLTFTAATGPTAERKTVAGTVNQYIRALWSGTFASATFHVSASRR